ncbi:MULTISPECIES: glycosyltransferase family 2 protein [Paraburkholderia]|uniref:glycosyltransferase family 2 protein n=1 Tax=Paraburkholderia TaxID=1822464 RepID=UPI002253F073|nr:MULTISPECIES: glycosyltransferase family 2 protein [Paraburkholderia]MCX4159952.1 glycosyltransferase family 2 protein [Paraburkholderia megapolitana]MDN7155452.1 glycosyltransferase [Paraburkholderia sp. CHISQ3]MDQ6492496.1 glycosyltransferase [Paraburkholderia megapolitana]
METRASTRPLLTIAIPTFNRAAYVELCLRQFLPDLDLLDDGSVEIVVSDNCSSDHTAATVEAIRQQGLNIRSIRNEQNIGSDANIAQCFNVAQGRYVQILGDDDLYLPGKLRQVVDLLRSNDYGVVCLKAYGYEHDFVKERPTGTSGRRDFTDISDFLYEVGSLVTFISACIINKDLQREIDARVFCGSNLVQVHLVILPALRAGLNAYVLDYILACKRANSGGYDFSEIFVEKFFDILKSYESAGLQPEAVNRLGNKMLISYYPFNLLRQRLSGGGNAPATLRRFKTQFGHRAAFLFFCAPIIAWPKPLAILWGWGAVLTGRIWNGELKRGMHFARHRLSLLISRP